MKKSRKQMVFLLTLLIGSLLCACGGTKGISEDDMKSDLQNAHPDFVVKSITVNDRRTSQADRTDNIYLTADVENDLFKGTIDYAMEYKLYDQGWLLENIYRDCNCDVRPLKGPDRAALEQTEELLPEQFVNESLDLENGQSLVYYQKAKEKELATVTKVTEWKSEFNDNTLSWSPFSKTGVEETSVVWNLEGTWRFRPYESEVIRAEDDYFQDCVIQISDVTSSKAHITVYHNSLGDIYFDEDMTLDPENVNKVTTPEIVLIKGYYGKRMQIIITTEMVGVKSDNPMDLGHKYVKDPVN